MFSIQGDWQPVYQPVFWGAWPEAPFTTWNGQLVMPLSHFPQRQSVMLGGIPEFGLIPKLPSAESHSTSIDEQLRPDFGLDGDFQPSETLKNALPQQTF